MADLQPKITRRQAMIEIYHNDSARTINIGNIRRRRRIRSEAWRNLARPRTKNAGRPAFLTMISPPTPLLQSLQNDRQNDAPEQFPFEQFAEKLCHMQKS
ncbi:MAG TPA: hypothetical protein VEB60_02365 [Candidatus Paceibacterota bacterium]|nr:hypothetical protein [Candidatus Paceibacterota bacterium]